jgi:hypothetical protein
MKNLILLLLLSAVSLVACQQKKEATTTTATAGGQYVCPMKCEGEKTYAEPGKCPVCNMDLVVMEGQATSATYEVKLVTTPDMIESGKPVSLAFTPVKMGDPTSPVALDEVHEHKMHVIIVSNDLSWYNHVHPVYQPDGSYKIEQAFPAGGEYIVFSDYQPTGSTNQVHRSVLGVNGNAKPKASFTAQELTDETDGYVVTMVPQAGKFLTNNLNHIGVNVTKDGKPYTNFESIMGAKGHLVIISMDGQQYLHVHPDEVDGKLDLHTQFAQPGLYRAFFQFQTNGKLHTSYFTLDVKEGKAGELGEEHGHDHGGEHTHDGSTHSH